MNILEVSKSLFSNSDFWKNVESEDKKKFFFIINRYLSKKFPDLSNKFNLSNVRGDVGLDIWRNFIQSDNYKKLNLGWWGDWFWDPKTNKIKDKYVFKKEDLDLIKKIHNIDKDSDIEYLVKFFDNELKEEIKFLKSKIKTNKK
jgi:hypothetical protein